MGVIWNDGEGWREIKYEVREPIWKGCEIPGDWIKVIIERKYDDILIPWKDNVAEHNICKRYSHR